MTTYVNFVQPSDAPMQFLATLDGVQYSITVPWNAFGQRYYVQINALDGTLILNVPRIESPLDYDINLVAGIFTTSTLIWRYQNNQFEISP